MFRPPERHYFIRETPNGIDVFYSPDKPLDENSPHIEDDSDLIRMNIPVVFKGELTPQIIQNIKDVVRRDANGIVTGMPSRLFLETKGIDSGYIEL
ncbi:MAG: hypothetical protein ACXABY_05960 [Candidatus Thorarchaeota archaeon]|jgi:hypothetical protein